MIAADGRLDADAGGGVDAVQRFVERRDVGEVDGGLGAGPVGDLDAAALNAFAPACSTSSAALPDRASNAVAATKTTAAFTLASDIPAP